MNITIQSVRFDASVQLEEFIQQKVGKLEQFFDGIVSAEVILKLDKSDSTENKVVEISLSLPGNELFAKKQNKTFEEGVDLAVDALRKQLIKWKEKVRAK
ncbi:ribosome hibernation-promoting factor, HPF/YfiA family [Carboxylicivirga sp. M1479]|uniref:ribosome hibernation-promoting factor, HPF/YfiA family n=1 Tax=Carboxylicivirga sp. M1479 TaxID=2594476 RepID=UPI001177E13A|nr:ribosome-associated translation inhibitor RaiA [Carboxylicivirga sp. M1479]TRX64319.1 ribosome-associated translation inhibitor RaiA [Carboxylicivirga sp. M1479]